MNKILETLEAEREELADWRHDFHMHPELGLEETRTAGLIVNLWLNPTRSRNLLTVASKSV